MEKCKYADKYKGTRPPECDGGNGCEACWGIYCDSQKKKQKKCKHPPQNLKIDGRKHSAVCGLCDSQLGSGLDCLYLFRTIKDLAIKIEKLEQHGHGDGHDY